MLPKKLKVLATKYTRPSFTSENPGSNPRPFQIRLIDYYIGSANEGEITVLLPRAYHTGMVNIAFYIMYFTAMEVYVWFQDLIPTQEWHKQPLGTTANGYPMP